MDDRPLIDIAEYEDARSVHTSNYTRSKNDFYPTPDWVTQALLDNAPLRGPVWEPCCGGGAMVRPIERRGHRVEATDIADHGFGQSGIDFMACRSVPAGCQSIVTNPPYGDGTVERGATKSARMLLSFVDHAIRLTEQNGGQLALLVRFTWIAGKRASTLISAGPLDRVLVLTRRICWFDLGPATKQGQHHHCWLFFDAQRDRAKPPALMFV
jgi:hypothetical protein